jgi:aryl-alcohol dehydrogenase-like predicted oxidoreductase
MKSRNLITHPFGKSTQQVTAVGLGGEGILRTFDKEDAAEPVIIEALLQGFSYFDSARVYAGSEQYYGSVWSRNPETRARIFQTSKSASRDKKGAMADLEMSLVTLKTDYLDLWQIHDLRSKKDFDAISGPNGALEAFAEARQKGKVRFIGVTGHHDPYLLTQAITEWPVDSVLMPVNPVESALGGFLDAALPAARKKGIAIIAMKVLGGGHYLFPNQGITAELLIRFALAQEVTAVIIGCANRKEVQTLASAARGLELLSAEKQQEMVDFFRPYARKLAFYRGIF